MDPDGGRRRRREAVADYPSIENPLGVKGIGKSGTALAIVSGIEDALSEYGVRIDEMPVSPARIFELVRKKDSGLRR